MSELWSFSQTWSFHQSTSEFWLYSTVFNPFKVEKNRRPSAGGITPGFVGWFTIFTSMSFMDFVRFHGWLPDAKFQQCGKNNVIKPQKWLGMVTIPPIYWWWWLGDGLCHGFSHIATCNPHIRDMLRLEKVNQSIARLAIEPVKRWCWSKNRGAQSGLPSGND